jgi:RNA polymerase sigma-70 factor (ECF subfamily)
MRQMVDTGSADAQRQEVFRGLVEKHARMVFRLAFRITRNEADAEDVVQETFLKAFRAFDQYDSRASFSTWLFRIASNAAIDLLRRRRSRPETPSDFDGSGLPAAASTGPSPHVAAVSSEIGRQLSEALEELSPHERTAFVLRHYEGEPIEEIARALGIRANAAKQTVFRAVRKLRLILEPYRENAS